MTEIRNLSMLSDFYEFTMGNGYYNLGMQDTIAVFDAFYRENPDKAGFAIFSGLEDIINYVENIHFTEEDIEFFRKNSNFSEGFLKYLKNFKFSGDIWAFKEGSAIFPGEPIITVKAPIIEAQIIETYLLLSMNFNSLITTKTNRIVRAAEGKLVMEFGARRAQGPDASIKGARAAYIGGAPLTSNTLSGKKYNFPVGGTMAHSWIQSFDTEYDAFKAFAEVNPKNCSLLVDTYDTLSSGLPNAIKIFKEIIEPQGYLSSSSIRIDSGDLAYLSKEARKRLNEVGLEDVKIVASNSLDEYSIESLKSQNAKIDSFGIGERLITGKSDPVFGGVYKLSAIQKSGDEKFIPKIKLSDNVEKITTPGFKNIYRIYDKNTGKAEADYITLRDEKIDESQPLVIFDPHFTWKMKRMENYTLRPMQVPIFKNGKRVYESPSIEEINDYCKSEVKSLWDEVKRFDQPHNYYVDLSHDLWSLKQELILEGKSR